VRPSCSTVSALSEGQGPGGQCLLDMAVGEILCRWSPGAVWMPSAPREFLAFVAYLPALITRDLA
jgi:hypothetical protein